jgi:2-alkyl-3-oxoalkanoate reductase
MQPNLAECDILSPLADTPVLVTGATGFLGSRLAAVLAERGFRVRAMIRPSSDLSRLAGVHLELAVADLASRQALAAAVAGQRLVFNCAARVSDWGARAEFFRVNVEGTRNLVEACLEEKVERLVHVSSLSVLGLPRDGCMVDETTPTADRPEHVYMETKLAAERVVLNGIRRGLSVSIIRPGVIWGSGEMNLLPRIERLLRARLFPLIDGGKNRVALSHIANVVDGMIRAALCPKAAGEIYHLTDGEEITAYQVFHGLARAFGLPPPRLRLPFRSLLTLGAISEGLASALGYTKGPALTRYAVRVLACDCRYDISKARRHLGYAPSVSFEAGVEDLAARRPRRPPVTREAMDESRRT